MLKNKALFLQRALFFLGQIESIVKEMFDNNKAENRGEKSGNIGFSQLI